MATKSTSKYIKASNTFIFSQDTKIKYRISEQDFTRKRKLPFEYLVLCMFRLLRKTIQIELNNFFSELNISVKSISSSAFIQNRKKLKPDLFYDLNHLIVEEFYSDNDENIALYKGLRVLSIDGSTAQLPFTSDLKNKYGTFNNQNKTDDVIIARVSVLYDVLNDIVLDGKLCEFEKGEVSLSREHFKFSKKGDLIIMDRSYPSFESIYHLQQDEIHFLFRCKKYFSNQVKAFYQSGGKEAIIEIKPSQHKSFKDLAYDKEDKISVRMVRIRLPDGEIEILMTSLLDNEKFPYKEFKALYFKRWKVETFYNRFKNIIGVEHFSGTCDQFIQQEFNCALYISNMQTIMSIDANKEVKECYKNRKYEYKVNSTLSLAFIRERLVKIFYQEKESGSLLQELQELFVKNVVPIRNGRKNKRDVDKYRQRTKPKQFNNKRLFV